MKIIYHDAMTTLWLGNADQWPCTDWVDFVLTNPYGPMPIGLAKTPAIIHQWRHRKAQAEQWSHMQLTREVSAWSKDREVFWANTYVTDFVPLNLTNYNPEPSGWYPEELVVRLLSQYVRPGQVVWDGFMGRSTVGKVCRAMGIKYIGVEQLERHMVLAMSYLDLSS